jgi:NADH:ubiquinone oxidoreductase subunit E
MEARVASRPTESGRAPGPKPTDANILPHLEEIQEAHGYLPRAQVEAISVDHNLPIGAVHAVASSFPCFRLAESEAVVEIGVCRDLICCRNGSVEFLWRLRAHLERQVRAGTVAIRPVSCLGLCDCVEEGVPALTLDGEPRYGLRSGECQWEVQCRLIDGLVRELDHDDQ